MATKYICDLCKIESQERMVGFRVQSYSIGSYNTDIEYDDICDICRKALFRAVTAMVFSRSNGEIIPLLS